MGLGDRSQLAEGSWQSGLTRGEGEKGGKGRDQRLEVGRCRMQDAESKKEISDCGIRDREPARRMGARIQNSGEKESK